MYKRQGYVVSVLVANGIAIAILAIGTRKKYGPATMSIQWPLVGTMLRYSTPLVPNSAMWWVVNMSSRFFLLANVDLATVGIYAIAVRVPTLISVLSAVFAQAWQLTAFREHSAQDRGRFYARVFEVYSSSLCLGVAVAMAALKPLLSLLVAPEFYTAWKFTPYLLIAALFMAFSSFVGTNYEVSMGTKHAFSTSLVGAVACVVLSAVLVPIGGGIGAAVATMGGYLVMWLVRVWNTRKLVPMHPRYSTLIVNLVLLACQVAVLNAGILVNVERTALISLIGLMIVLNRRELTDGWRQATAGVRQLRT